MSSPNLAIAHLASNQNQPEISVNSAVDDLDLALTNKLAKAMSDADYTLADPGEARQNMLFVFTGTLTANRNIIVPNSKKIYIVSNQTSGSFSLVVKTAAGTGITLSDNTYRLLYCDGTNVVQLTGSPQATANFSDAEVPGGSINGSNTAFTLAHSPNPAGSLQLYRNGQQLIAGGADYTLSGANITMVTAPGSGDTLIAFYRY